VKITAERIEKIMRYTFIFLTLAAIIYIIVADETVEVEQLSIAIYTLILFFLPSLFSKYTKIRIPPVFQIEILLFIFGSMYFGEVRHFYTKYRWWDTMLHSFSAGLLGYIGFLLAYTLNKDKNIHLRLSPFFIALFSLCFAMMIGCIWEFFEFFVDEFVGANMQKARNLGLDSRLGVRDTMHDLIIDFIGALLISIRGYYYSKKRDTNAPFWKIKDQFIEDNPELFSDTTPENKE